MRYIWQQKAWPQMTWSAKELEPVLSDASYRQGLFLGRLAGIGFDLQNRAGFEALSDEIVSSSAIEGETLNRADVRSSVARRMEVVLSEPKSQVNHALEARVDLMMDATRNWQSSITRKRLLGWHAALFPTGYSGLVKVRAGVYRDDRDGPMRVVSRYGNLERVHFEAPPADCLQGEMERLLASLNDVTDTPPLVAASLAHLRFLTLHPFEDGNGRLARALTEWLLARAEKSSLRFYSLSAQIQREKDAYYDELEHAQRNGLDVTRWVKWFVGCHRRTVESAEERLKAILDKAAFWQMHAKDVFNAHQREMLNRLLDGFEGNMSSSKWAKICKVSQDTASREISELVSSGVLRKVGQGRSTHYVIGCAQSEHGGSSGPRWK